MRCNQTAWTLLLGGSLSILNVGCAAVDALVSSPAGYSANSGSPERVAAIGRVFENQGRYAQARVMYQRALRTDPSNRVAKDRLEYLASLEQRAGGRDRLTASEEAVAVADKVARPTGALIAGTPQPEVPEDIESIRVVRAFGSEGTVQTAAAVTSGDFEAIEAPARVTPTLPASTFNITPADQSVMVESDDVASSPVETLGDAGIVRFDSEMADVVDQGNELTEWTIEPAATVADLDDVAATAEVIPVLETEPEVDSVWKASRQQITLDDVLYWSEDVEAHTDDLVAAVQRGTDEGVCALAASLLAEAPTHHPATSDALRSAAVSGSPLVQASALDALILRGQCSRDAVNGLVSLLTGDDGNVRAQAAATLASLAGTRWEAEGVEGLSQLLSDANPAVVAIAASSLSEFGSAAQHVRPALVDLAARSNNELVLEAASIAITRIPR